jgi:hypothetical protein
MELFYFQKKRGLAALLPSSRILLDAEERFLLFSIRNDRRLPIILLYFLTLILEDRDGCQVPVQQ